MRGGGRQRGNTPPSGLLAALAGESTAISMLVVFAMLFLFAAAGCGTDQGRSNQSRSLVDNFDQKRAEVERNKYFRLYYLGESFEGFALSSVLYDRDPWRTVSFMYGDCEPPVADGGCAPPLEVQVAPACARHTSIAPVERFTIRGVPASWFSSMLELYTGWEVITVFGGGQDRMRRAAREARDTSLTCEEQAEKTRR